MEDNGFTHEIFSQYRYNVVLYSLTCSPLHSQTQIGVRSKQLGTYTPFCRSLCSPLMKFHESVR